MPSERTKDRYHAFWRFVARIALTVFARLRCFGRTNVPATGGALLLSNHQSHLDPVLIGLAADRRLNYVGRDTLFRYAPFRLWMQSLSAIPIDREGLGLVGLKEMLRRLKRQEIVLLFPEGTRTRDGELARLKPGFCALARRVKLPLVPIGIDGAFDAWPRGQMLPRPEVIHVCFGKPIPPEEVADLSDDELVAEVGRRIRECRAAARRTRCNAIGRT